MSNTFIRHTVRLTRAEKFDDTHSQYQCVDRLLAEAQRAPEGSTVLIDVGRIPPWLYTHRLSELTARHQINIESEHVDNLHEWALALKGDELV